MRNWLIVATLVLPVQMVAVCQTSASSGTTTSPARTVHHKRHRQNPAVVTLPMEKAPAGSTVNSSPGSGQSSAQQQAADNALEARQRAASAQAARINDQQVKAAEAQQQRVQNEVRIQDAPGPAQTGVVPQTGPMTQPVNTSDRIQDAPGPAQTIPAPRAAEPVPAATTAGPTTPASTTPPQL